MCSSATAGVLRLYRRQIVPPPRLCQQGAMAVTHYELVLSILQKMDKGNFKVFRSYLKDEDFLRRYEYNAIPWSELEEADKVDVTNLLISHYTKEKAAAVTFHVLEAMELLDLAQQLRQGAESMENSQR